MCTQGHAYRHRNGGSGLHSRLRGRPARALAFNLSLKLLPLQARLYSGSPGIGALFYPLTSDALVNGEIRNKSAGISSPAFIASFIAALRVDELTAS